MAIVARVASLPNAATVPIQSDFPDTAYAACKIELFPRGETEYFQR